MTDQRTKITAILTALPGKAAELQTLLVGMAPLCRAEPGNMRWDVWRDRASDRFVLDELYLDPEAVEAHRATPHYQVYLKRIPDLAERAAWVLEPVATE